MGARMVRRLLRKGHECVVYDMQPLAVASLHKDGAVGAASLPEMVLRLSKPRAIWLKMVQNGIKYGVMAAYAEGLSIHRNANVGKKDPELKTYSGRVFDLGEGRWTIQAGIDEAVPMHVLSAVLFDRFTSRGKADFPSRILSAMRHEFGGHAEKIGKEME